MIDIEAIKKLREETGSSVMDCRDALEEAKKIRLAKNKVDKETLIVCEIGKNYVTTKHPESEEVLLKKAKELVDVAVEVRADVCKFQWHELDEIHPSAKITSPHFNQDRYEWVKRNVMSDSWWWELRLHCDKRGIEFLATPMSLGAAERMDDRLGTERWKVASGDILDFPMLEYMRDSGKHIILSSGMSSLEELKKSYNFISTDPLQKITILHCVSRYACPIENLNLSTIPFLQKEFPKAEIGFSSHCLDIRGSFLAYKLGAKIIEQHLTLDRNFWGPDHRVSLLPNEFKKMVDLIKNNEPLEII